MIIAIDGPSGSGKSSVARELARRLGFRNLDTGAIYRAITLRALRRGTPLDDGEALAALVTDDAVRMEPSSGPPGDPESVFLDGTDVTEAIRTPEVTAEIHWIARAPAVRERVTALVRRMAAVAGDAVAEGRDTTTAIFPSADLKLYVDASPEERARRRGLEVSKSGVPVDREALLAAILERDRRDRERLAGPLVRAPDAIYVETSPLSRDEVVDRLEAIAREAVAARAARNRLDGRGGDR